MSGSIGVGRTLEEIGDLIVGREKALRLPGRLEALHDARSPPGGLMAVLGSIVPAAMLAMLEAGHDLALRRAVAREFVGDHHPRC